MIEVDGMMAADTAGLAVQSAVTVIETMAVIEMAIADANVL